MSQKFDKFVNTIAKLRQPDGCPWDKEQTHKSLIQFLVEETYEVIDAIRHDEIQKLKDELGDLLLQIVLQSQIAADNNEFNIDDVIDNINLKMIERHPHVFQSQNNAITSSQVVKNWEDLKPQSNSYLGSLPLELPALLKALKISRKACSYGFEWDNLDDIWRQFYSEVDEFNEALANLNSAKSNIKNLNLSHIDELKTLCQLEFGDILFTLVNIARFNELDPEESLQLSIVKFVKRFEYMCQSKDKADLKKLTIDEWTQMWENTKKQLS